MNIERLQRLLHIMRELEVKDRVLTMGTWAEPIEDDDGGTICGTSCCALGWAALDPELHAQGLTLMLETVETESGELPIATPEELLAVMRKNPHGCYYPKFEDEGSAIESAVNFFGITREQSEWLFNPSTYRFGGYVRFSSHLITPLMVIRRLEKLIAEPDYTPESTFGIG